MKVEEATAKAKALLAEIAEAAEDPQEEWRLFMQVATVVREHQRDLQPRASACGQAKRGRARAKQLEAEAAAKDKVAAGEENQ